MSDRSQNQPDDELLDLVVKQVTEGLSEAEKRELKSREDSVVGPLRQEYEAAAALAVLYYMPAQDATPPKSLLEQLQRHANKFFGPLDDARSHPAEPMAELPEVATPRPRSVGGSLGWLAAAACLIAAVVGWMRPPRAILAAVAPVPVIARSASEERETLLARADTQKVTLKSTKDPVAAGVLADVVWDPTAQKGYLHLTGLRPNDPAMQQYQAWVFDATRDKRYPLGAALFDIPSGSSEVVIPLSANVPVRSAQAFAVTVEAPGGTVVPELAHVVVVGPAS